MSVPGNGAVPGDVTPGGIPALTNHSGRKFSHYPTKPPLVPVKVFSSAPNQHQVHLGIRAEPRWDIAFLIPSLSRFFPLPSFQVLPSSFFLQVLPSSLSLSRSFPLPSLPRCFPFPLPCSWSSQDSIQAARERFLLPALLFQGGFLVSFPRDLSVCSSIPCLHLFLLTCRWFSCQVWSREEGSGAVPSHPR